jgi:hypothetical protein
MSAKMCESHNQSSSISVRMTKMTSLLIPQSLTNAQKRASLINCRSTRFEPL